MSKQSFTQNLFIKDVTKLDCALFDPAHGVIGASWHVDISVEGELDHNGFVYDFSRLKATVKSILKETIDHALVIPIESKHVRFEELEGREHWLMKTPHFEWEYEAPKGAVFPIRSVSPRRAVIEKECVKIIRHRLPDSIDSVSVHLRGEDIDETEAWYTYTHGITGHDGLCQRAFHGHKSRIEIYADGERRPDFEFYIARTLFDSHIHISCPQQITKGHIDVGCRGKEGEQVEISYEGSLGFYRAVLPADRVFVVDRETSIELMTRTLAQHLDQKYDCDKIQIRCFEGIDKGSLVTLSK